MKEIQCPYCGSKLEFTGTIDFAAPAIQELPCKVCDYPLWITVDFPIPIRWNKEVVVDEKKPLINFNEAKKTNIAFQRLSESPPDDVTKGIYQDFSISRGLSESGEYITEVISASFAAAAEAGSNALSAVTGGIKSFGVWVIIILVLAAVILFAYKK